MIIAHIKLLNTYSCKWFSLIFNLWQEPDVSSGVNDDKRATLVMMKFSVDEVEFAMDKLGMQMSFKFLIL